MRLALQAAKSQVIPDVPIGAVVISATGEVLASASNERAGGTDPTAHAEVVALRAAGAATGNWRLDGCTLVVTVEPCPMCAGAAVNARVERLVFGAWNTAYGACGSVFDIPRDPRVTHRPEVVAGVLEQEAESLVQEFFATHRS